MQEQLQRDELGGGVRALAYLGAQVVHPADQALVELGMVTHRVEDPVHLLEQAGQDVVDVADRERVVGAVLGDRAVLARAAPVPGLHRRVALAVEQHVFALLAAGDQHRDRLRFREPGQVTEIAVLPVRVMRVVVADPLRRGRYDRDGPGAHHLHQLAPTARELGLFHARHCTVSGPVTSVASGAGFNSSNTSCVPARRYSTSS